MDTYIHIINGPSLNLIGSREPSVYGTVTMDDIIASVRSRFATRVDIRSSQHNGEGQIIDTLQACAADPQCLGVVINAGAYSHTSLAIADAIRAINLPVVEVHLSNVFAREPIRHQGFVAAACRGLIAGFGPDSYALAVDALLK